MQEKIQTLLSDDVATGMVTTFITRLHPSQASGGRITVSPEQLKVYTEAVIELAMNSVLDVMPEVIDDTVRRMENATNDR